MSTRTHAGILRAACPYCSAAFMVSRAQVDARDGLIRCHACDEVFDATLHWVKRADAEPVTPHHAARARAAARENETAEPGWRNSGDKDAEQYISPRGAIPRALPGIAAALALLLLLGWQVKIFALDQYAQQREFRGALVWFCRVANCELPLQRAPARITLLHTRIALHPREPDALRVTVKLANEAVFAQPYPDLQLTLKDRDSRIVGRRTFAAENYLRARKNLLESGELSELHFDLARPHEKAAGFDVDIVSRGGA